MGAFAAAGCAGSALGEMLRWEVGVAGLALSLHSKQLGATGSAHRLGPIYPVSAVRPQSHTRLWLVALNAAKSSKFFVVITSGKAWKSLGILVHGQVTIIFVVSVCLFVQSFSQPSLIRFRSN